MEIVSVPVIVGIVYILIEVYKKLIEKSKYAEKLKNIIPLIALIVGAGLGVGVYYIYPSIIPATNVWIALAVGAVSGLTATGSNQIVKQIQKLINGDSTTTTTTEDGTSK